jgi:hypothetical protein
MATFSDARETMLQEMKSVAAADSHRSKMQLVSIPTFEFKRPISCYFFDFEARFFNSKRISSAFVDLLRATYVFDPFCF